MVDWSMTSIDSLCERVTSGGTPSRREPQNFDPHGIPWVKTMDLQDRAVTEYDERISQRGLETSAAKILPSGTVLMAMYGATVGRLGWLIEDATCNQAACAMVADSEACCSRWLFYALLHVRDQMIGLANGAAQQNLNARIIKEYLLLTPPPHEQRAIAEVLGALDDKIAANRKVIDAADQWAEAKYTETLRSGGSQRVRISDVAVHKPGKYLSRDQYASGGAYDIFGSNSVMGTHDTALYPGRFAVLARIGSSCGALRWSQRPAWVNNNASAIVPRDGFPAPILRRALNRVDMNPHCGGSGQPFIRIDSLMSDYLVLPAQIDSVRLSAQLEDFAELEVALGVENKELAATRNGLLPLLMSGKLRVKDAEKQVGEVV